MEESTWVMGVTVSCLIPHHTYIAYVPCFACQNWPKEYREREREERERRERERERTCRQWQLVE
jgi:hypothetical protein